MKVLLLDADGVVLKKEEYFSDKFAREYNVSVEKVVEFFKGPFSACQAGTKDLKEELVPYLEEWGWKESVDAFLDYWFQDVVIDSQIEGVLNWCQKQGIKCYMASNNEAYRARKIEAMLGDALDGYFFSADLKVKKDDPTYFTTILKELNLPAEEVGFVDNEQKNIAAAEQVGIRARLFGAEVWSELFPEAQLQEFKNELR
jgi:putative hydrolase of the HAD superfamily